MHYKNGRSAMVGDHVVGRDWAGKPIAGCVVSANPGASTCNITVQAFDPAAPTYNSCDFLHVDDAIPKPATIAG